jgi:phage major head subunit gpT-like protein
VYGWIAQQLALRKWVGPRTIQNLSEHEYTLKNDPFEGTVALKRDDLEDDNLGIFATMTLPGLAEAVRKHPQALLVHDVLQGNPLAFDGLALFHASHPTYAKPNDYAPAPVTTYQNEYPNLPLNGTNFYKVWSDMVSRVGEDGLPLGVMPNRLIVAPQMALTARELMVSTNIQRLAVIATGVTSGGSAGDTLGTATELAASTIENQLRGLCEPLVVEQLANQPNTWYVADTTKAVKPLIYQVRRDPELVPLVSPTDPNVFFNRDLIWGVDYRGAAGCSLPFLISRAYPTGSPS